MCQAIVSISRLTRVSSISGPPQESGLLLLAALLLDVSSWSTRAVFLFYLWKQTEGLTARYKELRDAGDGGVIYKKMMQEINMTMVESLKAEQAAILAKQVERNFELASGSPRVKRVARHT